MLALNKSSGEKRGSHLGLLLSVLVLGLGLPGSLESRGVPELSADEEVLLVGDGAPALEADQLGQWTFAEGRPSLVLAEETKENLWFPKSPAAEMADGFIRARFALGDRLDSTVLFRATVDPNDVIGFSGYGLSIARDVVEFHRWDRGEVQAMGESTRIKSLRTATSVELALWLVGPHMVAQLYDGKTLESLGSLVISDSTYPSGRLGLRTYVKQDAVSHLTHLSVRAAGTKTGSHWEPAGARRFAELDMSVLSDLPAGTDLEVVEPRGEDQSRVLVNTDRRGLELLRRAGVTIHKLEPEATFAFLDSDYRKQRGKAPERTATGFRTDASYKDADMVEALIRAYHERFPAITKLVELGQTHEGRPILALKISDNVEQDEDEPAVLLNGAHHGEELLSIEFALDAMATLLEGYKGDSRIKRMVNGAELWVVPLVNPDGAQHHITASLRAGRKNGRPAGDEEGFQTRNGVDLNRNYPFRWHSQGEATSSSDPRHSWYRGPVAGSEPETQAMMRLADSEHFAASLSYHTLGTLLLVPYTIDNVQNPQPNEAWGIAEAIAELTPEQPNGRKYKVVRNMYSVDGVDQDWLRAAHGTVALMIEGPFSSPSETKRLASVESTRETWMSLVDRVLDGPSVYGSVHTASGEPVVAKVSIDEVKLLEGEVWTSRCRDGRFERLLPGEGSYTVRVEVAGLEPMTKSVKVRAGARKRVDFELANAGNAALVDALCSDRSLCSAQTVCEAEAGRCVSPGAPSWCRLDGVCHEAGSGEGCERCEPSRLALEWSAAPTGTACGAASCEAGIEHGAASCAARGGCVAAEAQSCAPYLACDGAACARSCRSDGDCVDGARCEGGSCVADEASSAAASLTAVRSVGEQESAKDRASSSEGGCQQGSTRGRDSGSMLLLAMGLGALALSLRA